MTGAPPGGIGRSEGDGAVCLGLAGWTTGWPNGPGERAPMLRKADGTPTMRVSPLVAAAFVPALSVIVGVVTIVAAVRFGGGRAPVTNVILPAVFVAAHWMQVSMAAKVLEQERK